MYHPIFENPLTASSVKALLNLHLKRLALQNVTKVDVETMERPVTNKFNVMAMGEMFKVALDLEMKRTLTTSFRWGSIGSRGAGNPRLVFPGLPDVCGSPGTSTGCGTYP